MDCSEERVEVAERLREKAQERFYPGSFSFGVMDSDCWTALCKALRVGNNYQVLMDYIADLIDPTCEMVPDKKRYAGFKSCRCTACGYDYAFERYIRHTDDCSVPAKHMWRYGPHCGARITDEA